MTHLLCIGMGYSAREFGARMPSRGWRVSGTSRTAAGVAAIKRAGFAGYRLDAGRPDSDIDLLPADVTHLLVSAAPEADGDPVLASLGEWLSRQANLEWIGYLSTVAVYGDQAGGWVDESTPAEPTSRRGKLRRDAERAWQAFGQATGKNVCIFRLPGIYGPGRGPFEKVRQGTDRRIIKAGQVFNRIHVTDIANALEAVIDQNPADQIFNVSDDEPAPPQDVIGYAAELLGMPPPPEVSFEEADMPPMARSFYAENKRVRNDRIKSVPGFALSYPTYREGLEAIRQGEAHNTPIS